MHDVGVFGVEDVGWGGEVFRVGIVVARLGFGTESCGEEFGDLAHVEWKVIDVVVGGPSAAAKRG